MTAVTVFFFFFFKSRSMISSGSSISNNIDICINNIDFNIASLIPQYTLCLLRS